MPILGITNRARLMASATVIAVDFSDKFIETKMVESGNNIQYPVNYAMKISDYKEINYKLYVSFVLIVI